MARCGFGVAFLALAISAAVAAAGPPVEGVSSFHGPVWRAGKVTSIVFSSDGRWIIANYFRPARNRPGTDWRAFIAHWEIAVKARPTVINSTAKTPQNPRFNFQVAKGAEPKDAAETVPGESTKFFGPLAEAYGIYLTVPLLEVDRKTGKYYNTSVLLGPDGRILIHYRKRNPWKWAEKGWAAEGNLGNPVVDTPFGRLGLLICFDVHDQFKVMSKLKIDTLLYSIAWVDDVGSDWFSVQLPAKVKECGFNVIGANWTVPRNPKPAWHGYGKSLIVSSKGEILGKAKNDLAEETVYAEIPIPPK